MLRYLKLSEVADLTVGFVGTMAEHYVESGIPFLRSLNIKPYYISGDDIKYISSEFNKVIKKSILHENDVVIVRTGVPGTCCVVPPEYDGCNCSDVVIVRPNTTLLDPHYLCAYINIWGKKQITDKKVGAIQQHFNVHTAEDMVIALPDLNSQKEVSTLITALNTRIAITDNVCHELESLAKTIYDYWFVQFDFPDAEGKPYRSSGGQMVWNKQQKRELPVGWRVSSLVTDYDVCYGFPFDTDLFADCHEGSPVVRIRDIQTCSVSAYTNEIVDKKYLLTPEDFIIGMDGNFHMNFWFGSEAYLNQRCVRIRKKNAPILLAYFASYAYIKAREKNVSKTTVGHLSADDIQNLNVALPPEKVGSVVFPVFDEIIKSICIYRSQAKELTSLRDWLLPMLMNGQATVE